MKAFHTDTARAVATKMTVSFERLRVFVFGVHVASIYTETLESEGVGTTSRRWLFVGPKNFGLGLQIPSWAKVNEDDDDDDDKEGDT
jgi:hypothetical protein